MDINDVYDALAKHFFKDPDRHKEEYNYLLRLLITKIELVDGAVCITTARPGMVIGAKGRQIDALEKAIGLPVKIFEANDHPFDNIYASYQSQIMKDI